METASSPILFTPRFRSGATRDTATTAKLYFHIYGDRLCCNSLIASPRNYHCRSLGRRIKSKLRSDRFTYNASTRNTTELNPSQKFAVLIEVEGVLMDVYRLGNRHAFNVAFKKLGLDCANWTEPVYLDLVRVINIDETNGKDERMVLFLPGASASFPFITKDEVPSTFSTLGQTNTFCIIDYEAAPFMCRKSAGDEERMLILYFNRIGWPTSVATSEKGTFMKKVLREKKNALDDLVMSKAFSLRPGAEEFIDEACEEGVPVVFLTAYSGSGEKVARSIVEKLGSDRMSKTKIVGDDEVKQSFYGQLVFGEGPSSSLDEQLAKEVSKAASAERQRIAEEVASMLKLKVELNSNSSESLQNIVAALRAGAEYAEVPIYKCVLVAGSQSGVAAAERISMPCVVLRSSSTSRAEFPSAVAVMDGFGGADLTISRLRRKLWS